MPIRRCSISIWRGKAAEHFLLRIEDIDATRCRPESRTPIYEDLAWLGISWQQDVRRQSAHFACYRAAIDRLEAMGLIYPSFESRSEITRLVAQREAEGPGRAIPMARRSIPAPRRRCHRPSGSG